MLACALALSLPSLPAQSQTTTTYTYDGAGRLVRAVDIGGATVAYAYDAAGNRIQVSNGMDPGELLPTAYAASSALTGSVAPTPQTMRDGEFDARASIAATAVQSDAWIKLDLGASKNVATVKVAPPNDSGWGLGAEALAGARLEYSDDDAVWLPVGDIAGVIVGAYKEIIVKRNARYLRVSRPGVGQVAMGDFRVYQAQTGAPVTLTIPPFPLTAGLNTAVSFNPVTAYASAQQLPLTLFSVQQRSEQLGTATLSADKLKITYTPPAGFTGQDQLAYSVVHQDGRAAEGLVTITVTSSFSNTLPVANNDKYWTSGGRRIVFDPRANDTDPNYDTLEIVSFTSPGSGKGVVMRDDAGRLVYTPPTTFVGTATFNYTISDGRDGTATATVEIEVAPAVPNRSPVPQPDTRSTMVDTPLSLNPLLNDSDPDEDPLAISSVGPASAGTAVRTSFDTITYTPAPGYEGVATFTYTVVDGRGGSGSATVTISTLAGANQPPVATNDVRSARTPYSLLIDPRINDSDPDGDPLTITNVVGAQLGAIAGVSPTLISYNPGAVGTEVLTYTVSDGKGGNATATITIQVTTDPNYGPNPADDYIETDYNTPVTFDPTANDTDDEGDPIGLASVGRPRYGTVTSSGPKALTYTPPAGFTGIDTFIYNPWDFNGGSSTSTYGTVRVRVWGPVNQAPLAVDDARVTSRNEAFTFDPRLNDSDPDGNSLVVAGVGEPSHGVAVFNGSGTAVTYTPDPDYTGPDGFSYTLSDKRGGTSQATVTMTVRPEVNRAPVPAHDSWTTPADQPITFDPRSNDSDPDGDPLTIVSATSHLAGDPEASLGQITVTDGGRSLTFWPYSSPIATGTVTVSYLVSDGRGGTTEGTASVSLVATTNLPPQPVQDTVVGKKNQKLTIDVLANDTDPNGDSLTVHYVSTSPGGQAYINPDNKSVTFWPYENWTGTTSIPYFVIDSGVRTAQSYINITVAENQLPVAANDAVTATKNTPLTFDPRANDGDADGDTLALTDHTPASHGTVTRQTNSLTYTPATDYYGTDSFTYTISDGFGGTSTATVTVLVNSGLRVQIDYLVVAGGGGGAGAGGPGAGGGGGGVRTGTLEISAGQHAITVGPGGAAGHSLVDNAGDGGPSAIGDLVSATGGGGARRSGSGRPGGSGGGVYTGYSSTLTQFGGEGVPGEGYRGGNPILYGGPTGGGGATQVGGSGSTSAAGGGGMGLTSDLSGAPVVYGSGGGGGSRYLYYEADQYFVHAFTPGAGGPGAGSGSMYGNSPTNGVAGRGGGGGGGGITEGDYTSRSAGGWGGSGIVIIRYLTGSAPGATGGIVTTSGEYTIHTFTTSGTFSIP